MRAQCAVCRGAFEAQRITARYCGETCRKRAQRDAKREKTAARREQRRRESEPEHPLVTKARAELTEAGKADTLDGLLVLELARDVARSGPAGKVGLVREFQRARATALGRVVEAPAEDGDGDESSLPTPGDARLDEVRRKRDEKRASLATG